ncbi:MAG: TetR/AcrR family transcriptional regulator [Actinobacteria bacterium]|uniref:Unannotated protein n=1 Tax=freshwater metagenome TaxID=449393 RepID=A0A6J7G1P2_9ZZZZ|nr:TetR/AcrR family transcriptional regulator [Actinomycetota bacterium]
MPPRIDRTARRREVVEAYLALVAREGMGAASSRALAVEMGVSTGSLWHWFADFDEVLHEAFASVFRRADDRIAAARAGLRGLPALAAALREILPLVKETDDEAHVVVAFWGRVASSPALGDIHRDVMRTWTAELVDHLGAARDDHQLRPGTPVAQLADVLLVLSLGQQVARVVDAELTTPERQWALVGAVLAPWSVPGAATDLPWGERPAGWAG